MFKKLAVAAAALALFFPSIALAQDAPPPEDAPSYAQQQEQSPDEQIRGRVVAFDGGYALTVQDERGYQDNVQLHQGTIINPTGLTLEPGMTVSILGYNAGAFFAANEIDTPYQFVAGVPYFYGHPYFYYGPSVSLDFFFGRGGWWHPEYFGGGFRYVGGARFYNSVRIGNVYGGNGYYGGAAYDHAYRAPLGNGAYRPSHYGAAAYGERYGQGQAYNREQTRAQGYNAYRGAQNSGAYRGTQSGNAYRGYTGGGNRGAQSSAHAAPSGGSHGGGGEHGRH
jgi:hypothetical protein